MIKPFTSSPKTHRKWSTIEQELVLLDGKGINALYYALKHDYMKIYTLRAGKENKYTKEQIRCGQQ